MNCRDLVTASHMGDRQRRGSPPRHGTAGVKQGILSPTLAPAVPLFPCCGPVPQPTHKLLTLFTEGGPASES